MYILARILGLPNEHTRPNRNHFLTIHKDNIERKVRYIFRNKIINKENLQPSSEFHNFYDYSSADLWENIEGLPYDYTSVTHVGPFEHAIDPKKPTVSSKYPEVKFGDKMNLSVIDVQKQRTLYKCLTGTCNSFLLLNKFLPILSASFNTFILNISVEDENQYIAGKYYIIIFI